MPRRGRSSGSSWSSGLRVILNRRAIDALRADPGVVDDLGDKAERVADAARSSAPVLTGEYRASIRVETEVVDGVGEARVISDTDHSIYVEADTGNLTRALDAAGGE